MKNQCIKTEFEIMQKKLKPIEFARYVGVIVDENLNQKKHVNDISYKLKQDNAILSKIRNYFNKGTLRTVYFSIFHSYISHVPIA